MLRVLGPSLLLVFWAVTTGVFQTSNIFFPGPGEVITTLITLIKAGSLNRDLLYSTLRTLAAFSFAVIFAVPIAIFLGLHSKLAKMTEFLFDFFRTLPSVALLPLFILLFGINDVARIALASFTGFLILAVTILYGMTHMRRVRLSVLKVMKANKRQIFMYGVVWEILPSIFSGMKLAFPVIFIIVVTSEMIASPQYGFGTRIIEYQQTYKIPEFFSVVIIMGGVGYIVNKLLSQLEGRVIHWTKH